MTTTSLPAPLGDEPHLALAQRGDLEAFNILVRKYQDLAFHHAYAIVGDPDLAEDLAQEGFIRAFRNLAGFRGGSFRSWLLKIVTNAARDHLRRGRRHPWLPLFPVDEHGQEHESPAWLRDPAPSVQELVERSEANRQLLQTLNELPEAFRMALTLVDLYELDYLEAATVLSVPVGTLKSRLARARLQLRERLRAAPEPATYPAASLSAGCESPA